MMRLILAFIILTVSIWAGVHVQHNPGYVLITIAGWSIETTLWFAVLALVLFFILLHALLSLFHKPAQWRHGWQRYKEKKHLHKELAKIRQEEYQHFQQQLSLTTLQELEKTGTPEAVDTFFQKMSRKLRNLPVIKEEYIHYLIQDKQYQKAEKILRKALGKTPHNPELITLYGLCYYHQKQIPFAESLLRTNPEKNNVTATLYLCLGRLCMHWQLWGKAKHYLEKSLDMAATPEAHQALATLFEAIDDEQNAYRNYKEGLKLTVDS